MPRPAPLELDRELGLKSAKWFSDREMLSVCDLERFPIPRTIPIERDPPADGAALGVIFTITSERASPGPNNPIEPAAKGEGEGLLSSPGGTWPPVFFALSGPLDLPGRIFGMVASCVRL
jgi:hypothetical protein